jgi:hypothetical protein
MTPPLTDIFIKMRIVITMNRLATNDNFRAAKLLNLTLKDINVYGIHETGNDRLHKIRNALKKALVFTYKNLNTHAVTELKEAGLELYMDNLIRKHLVMRESDSALNSLPYDIRDKIASYI